MARCLLIRKKVATPLPPAEKETLAFPESRPLIDPTYHNGAGTKDCCMSGSASAAALFYVRQT